jgi:putative cardiolipin synthase
VSARPDPARPDPAESPLGQSIQPLAQAHPAESGVFTLRDGRDAFAARVLLADAARHTLDVQYYIWHADMSGTLLFEAVHRAADRGVLVRLLLDDNNTSGLDAILAALDAHPNIEVRLFNPFPIRRWRALAYLTDFARLNRRMHNKSYTADAQATIIGGRNVGDEYFDAGQELSFVDLDVLAIGPVVGDVSRDFERYWTSGSAHRASRVLSPANPAAMQELAAAAARVERDPAAQAYRQAIAGSPFVRQLLQGELPFEWATTQMVSDDPAKGLGLAGDNGLLLTRLELILKKPSFELDLVSPYFVPTAAGVAYFTSLARKGVKITVLTNSLAATDVAVVHAGYAKRRRALLKVGVTLFEAKRLSSSHSGKDRGLTGSSASALHAKTFSVDRSHVFVGSLNLDPRSARLNTELGFVIDSPSVAQAIADAFDNGIAAQAYRVRLGAHGRLLWIEKVDGQETVHHTEPGTRWWWRVGVVLLSWLPIEWLL